MVDVTCANFTVASPTFVYESFTAGITDTNLDNKYNGQTFRHSGTDSSFVVSADLNLDKITSNVYDVIVSLRETD